MDFSCTESSNRTSKPLIAAAFLTTLLSACGGGGGGGGGGNSNPAATIPNIPVVSYSGNRNPMLIDKNSAADAAEMVIYARAMISVGEQFWIEPPASPGTYNQTETGGGGTATIRAVTNSDMSGYLTVAFNDYSSEGITYSGNYIQRFQQRSNVQAGYFYSAISGSVEFDSIRMTANDLDLSLQGTIENSGGNSQRLIANFSVNDNQSNQQIFFDHLNLDFSTLNPGYFETIATEFSGTIYDKQRGRIDITSEAPMNQLTDNTEDQLWRAKDGGNTVITGSGPTLAMRPLSTRFLALMLDNNGDNVWDESLRIDWKTLSEERAQTPNNNRIPVTNAGNTFAAYVNSPATVHALFSHDDDQDYLTHHWRLILKPTGSQVTLTTPTSPVLQFIPDIPGDYVFTAQTSDGANSSESSVMIRARPALASPANSYVAQTLQGGLELIGDTHINQPITIDGQSAINSRDANLSNVSWMASAPLAISSNALSLSSYANTLTTFLTTSKAGLFTVTSREIAIDTNVSLNISVDAGPFEIAALIRGPFKASRVLTTDFNSDGNVDFVITGYDESASAFRSFVALNNGTGSFTQTTMQPGVNGTLAAGDLNGDGRVDIAAASSDEIVIFYQTSTGDLGTPTPYYSVSGGCAGGSSRALKIGDFDGDGLNDLLAMQPCGNALLIWKQQLSHTLATMEVHTLTPDNIRYATFADMNNDGRLDIVFGAFNYPSYAAVAITQPDGSSIITNRFDNTGLFNEPNVGVGDINNDGLLDVLQADGQHFAIYSQTPSGGFSLFQTLSDGETLDGNIVVQDLDGDSLADICMHTGYQLSVALRQTQSEFTNLAKIGTRTIGELNSFALGDINGDNKLDVIFAGADSTSNNDMLTVLLGGVSGYSKVVP